MISGIWNLEAVYTASIITPEDTGPSIVTDNLILNLDSEDTDSYPGSGTTWFDLTDNGNDATLLNGLSYNSSDQGFTTDFGNDKVQLTQFSQNPTELTIEMWLNANDSTMGTDQDLFIVDRHASGEPFVFWLDAGNDAYAWLFTDTSSNYSGVAYSTSNIAAGQYSHIVITFKAGQSSYLYINGVQDSSVLDVSSLSNAALSGDAAVLLNETNNTSTPFNGTLSVTRVYDRELTQAEITNNYNVLSGRYGV